MPNHCVDLGQVSDARLDVLVENMGRVNYAEFRTPVLNSQRKGRPCDVVGAECSGGGGGGRVKFSL